MIRKTVNAISSSALVAAGFIASGTTAPAPLGVGTARDAVPAQIVLSRDQAIALAEAATGARTIEVSYASGDVHGQYGIEMTRVDRSLVLVLVAEADGAVHLLDMGDIDNDAGRVA